MLAATIEAAKAVEIQRQTDELNAADLPLKINYTLVEEVARALEDEAFEADARAAHARQFGHPS